MFEIINEDDLSIWSKLEASLAASSRVSDVLGGYLGSYFKATIWMGRWRVLTLLSLITETS